MVGRCPNEAKPPLYSIFKLTSDKIAYGPNYYYENDREMADDNDDINERLERLISRSLMPE